MQNNYDTMEDEDEPVASTARSLNLFWTTPLLYSPVLSALVNNKTSISNAYAKEEDNKKESTAVTTPSSCTQDPPQQPLETKNKRRLPLRKVFLKLDCLQSSGSFKDRGMGHLLVQQLSRHQQLSDDDDDDGSAQKVSATHHIYSSSGGNAGLAAASIAQKLQMPCTVVVPTTTQPSVIETLQSLYQAQVIVHGPDWNAADAFVHNKMTEHNNNNNNQDGATATTAVYAPPYDHECLWTGHSTVVDEIFHQLAEFEPPTIDSLSPPPNSRNGGTTETSANTNATIILSVGGGGLLCGVLEGLQRHQQKQKHLYSKCRVLAAETVGASSFAKSWNAMNNNTIPTTTTTNTNGNDDDAGDSGGGHGVVTVHRLDSIDSIATSLGALSVTPAALERSRAYQQQQSQCPDDDKAENGRDNKPSTSAADDDNTNTQLQNRRRMGNSVESTICTDAEAVDACLKVSGCSKR